MTAPCPNCADLARVTELLRELVEACADGGALYGQRDGTPGHRRLEYAIKCAKSYLASLPSAKEPTR